MSKTEQAIRITAQGEFGQLQRGLKDLQSDLKSVLGEIDKGARRGGFFDDTQLRALDVYKNRFKDTLEELNKEFDKQSDAVDKLYDKLKKAYAWEKDELQNQIRQREAQLDVIQRTRQAMEDTYRRRNTEASGYGSSAPSGSTESEGSYGGGMAIAATGTVLQKAMGAVGMIGKFALGLAGLSSVFSLVTEAYQLARTREVGSLDLAQRLRGHGFSGSNTSMYDSVSAIGRSDNMGYSQAESWELQDAYTSEAGTLGAGGQLALQKFARGYGLDASTVGGMAGNAKQLGGTSTPKQFADMIAGSVEKSDMVPRILEVMRTHSVLLQSLSTTFKDTNSTQILAYQTTLDRLGNANGMTRLTGAQGANVIQGLGGIFQPDDDKWKWTGITALKQYNSKKYGSMGLYDLESSFEDGMQNPDNIPAMAKYLKSMSGGNNDTFKRLMQSWLTEGGFKATKSEVTELDKVTNGFTAFDPDKIDKVIGDSGAKYDNERKDEAGQKLQEIEANFNKDLEELGQKILPVITNMKEDMDKIFKDITGDAGFSKTVSDILGFLKDSGLDLVAGILMLGVVGQKALSAYKSGGNAGGTRGGSDGSASEEPGSSMSDFRSRRGLDALDADTEAMLNSTAEATGLSRSGLEQAFRENGDNGVDAYVASGGRSAGSAGSAAESGGSSFLGNIGSKIGGILKNPVAKAAGGIGAFVGLDYLMNNYYDSLFGWNKGDINFSASAQQPDNSGFVYHQDSSEGSIPKFFKNLFGIDSSSNNVLDPNSTSDNSIAGMSKSGTKSMNDFRQLGYNSLDKFSTSSHSDIENLYKKGSNSYDSMNSTTEKKLDEIKGIHQAFFSSLENDYYGSGSGSDTTGSGDSGISSSLSGSGVSGSRLNSILGGKLSGMGDTFVAAGNKYGIDPAFLAAISMTETGNGKYIGSNNNVAGMMGSHGLMSFGSISEGINAEAQNLYSTYIKQGLTTPSAIQKRYAPIGAANDPTNLNRNWLPNVLSFYDELTGGSHSGSSSVLGSGTASGSSSSGGLSLATLLGKSNHIVVDVNLNGSGVSQLNSATQASIKSIVAQAIAEYKQQQLATNPSVNLL